MEKITFPRKQRMHLSRIYFLNFPSLKNVAHINKPLVVRLEGAIKSPAPLVVSQSGSL